MQVGIIDVEVEYSDGTTMPLKHISPEDYYLEVSADDSSVLGVVLSDGPAYPPKVIAEGKAYRFSD